MRQVHDPQRYLDFSGEASPKVVEEYRREYREISRCLDANPLILQMAHEDLEKLSKSRKGRKAKYTTENLFRALLVHQLEKTSLRETVIRIAESPTLQAFVRLGPRPVMDYSFLDRAFKAVTPETWKLMNEELAKEAVRSHDLDVSKIRVDSTVIETNIHYPTDISLLWDAYCVLTRLLRAVRDLEPELCPHRFHDRKAKQDYLYVTRYQQSKSKDRRRKVKRHFRRLHTTVRRIRDVGRETVRQITGESPLELQGLKIQLKHYLPLVGTVLNTSERAFLKGEKVPAEERIFSLFEEHTELIMRGKARKPVEFGHAIWITQNPDKLILDYEVMDKKVPDAELLEEVTQRHKALYRGYPEGLTADAGFRASAENMEVVKKRVVTLAVPGRGRNKRWMDAAWHRFRAGVEGTFSVLKRAFRLIVCLYRGFKSFEAAVGMAVFCHNLRLVAPARANP